MRLAVAACLLAACSFQHGSLGNQDGSVTGSDATDGRASDGLPDACITFSTHLDTCMPGVEPGGPLVLTGTNSYDTDNFTLTTPNGAVAVPHQTITVGGDEIAVILVQDFRLGQGGTLRVTGTNNDRPLGIVSYGTVQIDGAIDLSKNGAGARDDTACGNSTGHDGANDNGGGGGGGGGAFAGDGGDGENGDSDGGQSNGGPKGTKVARPDHVKGGCDGGPGGQGSNNGAEAGDGGGAIFIAAAVKITIGTMGSINAGGGGGTGGDGNGGGGGGGGSGGMIVLESGSIAINGKVAANGGGGGEGADGADGQPGETGALGPRANGGSGQAPEGGDGGDGGAGSSPDGVDANNFKKGGGGGGGGGVGFIAMSVAPMLNNATISPPYAAWP